MTLNTELAPDIAREATGQEAFSKSLDQLTELVPEIGERRDSIEAAGNELVEIYGVTPVFFDDTERSVLFASLAGNDATEQVSNGQASWSDHSKRREFIANTTFLLTKDYSDKNQDLIARHKEQEEGGFHN